MRSLRRNAIVWLAFVAAAVAWSSATVGTLRNQESMAARDAAQSRTAQVLLTGLLDQETAARAFANTDGDETYLAPFTTGRRDLVLAVLTLRPAVADDPELRRRLAVQAGLAQQWQLATDDRIQQIREGSPAGGDSSPADEARARERMALVDRYRTENAGFQRTLARARTEEAAASTRDAILLVVGLGLGLAAGAILLVVRRSRGEVLREEARSEFGAALSTADDEPEAHDLITRHLRRSGPLRDAHVLVRDADQDHVRPAEHDDVVAPRSPLRDALREEGSRACLAVRHAQVHRQGGRSEQLRRCELCGRVPGATTCAPLIVGGQVMGAVLGEHPRPLTEQTERVFLDSVRQAAPFLGNLRTLARAEAQAATDSLTGLPNRRVIEETLSRLLAQATRSITPLSVIVMDLDHFKRINDTLGHAAGDAALASLGRLLRRLPRASDVAGRWGGEEFVVVLPDTDAAGAAKAAEGLRTAVADLSTDGTTPYLTASMGIASYPEHASDAEALLRLADDALYAAKQAGRDRVEVTEVVES